MTLVIIVEYFFYLFFAYVVQPSNSIRAISFLVFRITQLSFSIYQQLKFNFDKLNTKSLLNVDTNTTNQILPTYQPQMETYTGSPRTVSTATSQTTSRMPSRNKMEDLRTVTSEPKTTWSQKTKRKGDGSRTSQKYPPSCSNRSRNREARRRFLWRPIRASRQRASGSLVLVWRLSISPVGRSKPPLES